MTQVLAGRTPQPAVASIHWLVSLYSLSGLTHVPDRSFEPYPVTYHNMVDSAGAKTEGKKRNRTAYAELTASGEDGKISKDSVDVVDRETPPPGDKSDMDESVIKNKKKKKKKPKGPSKPASGANKVAVGKKVSTVLTASVDAAVEKELAKQATTAPDIPKETTCMTLMKTNPPERPRRSSRSKRRLSSSTRG